MKFIQVKSIAQLQAAGSFDEGRQIPPLPQSGIRQAVLGQKQHAQALRKRPQVASGTSNPSNTT